MIKSSTCGCSEWTKICMEFNHNKMNPPLTFSNTTFFVLIVTPLFRLKIVAILCQHNTISTLTSNVQWFTWCLLQYLNFLQILNVDFTTVSFTNEQCPVRTFNRWITIKHSSCLLCTFCSFVWLLLFVFHCVFWL